MEKYHIYEEIGKGNFSQVYKGREKKKVFKIDQLYESKFYVLISAI